MSFYWVYEIAEWQFFLLTNVFFVLVCMLGPLFLGQFLRKKLKTNRSHNEAIGIFISISGVLYGVTMGLLAVGTYENFNEVEQKVADEVSALNAIFRDVTCLKGKGKQFLKKDIEEYTEYVIEKAWPLQRQGIVPKGGIVYMDHFITHLSQYEPVDERDFVIYEEVFDQFNVLIEKRRHRLNSIDANLPGVVWIIVIVGAMVNILFVWLLEFENQKLDLVLNILLGSLFGSLIFLIVSMDNPYRGEYSVSSEPYRVFLETIVR